MLFLLRKKGCLFYSFIIIIHYNLGSTRIHDGGGKVQKL